MGLLRQCEANRFDDAFGIHLHVIVGKVQHAVSLRPQHGIAGDIAFWGDIVGIPVHFHDQLALSAEKICKERANLHLPAEFGAELRVRQIDP